MATVSTLLVNLKANTAAFVKGMKKSKKHLSSFGASAMKIGKTVTKGFALVGAAAVGAGIALSIPVKKALGAIDTIAKMSSELDISTEALSGFEHAAKITGASLPDLHKGMQIMVRRLGEAKQGYGEGKKGLEALGLSAEQVANMGTEEAFTLIADKISKLENVTDKVSAAYSIFGRQGVNMLNTLNLGADGLAEMRAEAEKLGITFNRFEAGQVEQANDAITKLKSLVDGVTKSLAIALAPYITYVSDSFVEMGKGAGGATQWISDKLKGLVNVLSWVIKGVNIFKGVFNTVAGAIYKGIEWIIKGFVKLTETMAKVAEFVGADKLAKKLSSVGEVADIFAEGFNELASEKFDSAGENFNKAFKEDFSAKIEAKLKDDRKKVELGIGKNPLAVETLQNEDKDKKKTEKKADALSFSSALIDVKGMKGSGADPQTKELKKDVQANKTTAQNTTEMLRVLKGAVIT